MPAYGSETGLQHWYAYERARMEQMDAYVAVRKAENICELADVPPQQMALFQRYWGELHNKIRLPRTKWCVLRYPNASMAQQAGMSCEAFEDFYFSCCLLDYAALNRIVQPLVDITGRTDQVRIVAPGTDITFSIKGLCPKEAHCGIRNLPCGEIGMPVVPDSVNGVIAYNMPTYQNGFVFTDVRFVLQNGKIIKAASNNTPLLNQILDIDPNARRIGEFAMGFNPFVTRPILDTLFDEKMAQSIHFTPGNSPVNPSALHWDIVQSHAPHIGGGEIWFDGQLIRKNGLFVLPELQPINPEPLKKAIAPAL